MALASGPSLLRLKLFLRLSAKLSGSLLFRSSTTCPLRSTATKFERTAESFRGVFESLLATLSDPAGDRPRVGGGEEVES